MSDNDTKFINRLKADDATIVFIEYDHDNLYITVGVEHEEGECATVSLTPQEAITIAKQLIAIACANMKPTGEETIEVNSNDFIESVIDPLITTAAIDEALTKSRTKGEP